MAVTAFSAPVMAPDRANRAVTTITSNHGENDAILGHRLALLGAKVGEPVLNGDEKLQHVIHLPSGRRERLTPEQNVATRNVLECVVRLALRTRT